MRTQTFRCPSDDDRDRLPGAAFKDIRTGFFGDRTDSHGEDDVPVEGNTEVGGEGEEVGDDSRESFGETGGCSSEGWGMR